MNTRYIPTGSTPITREGLEAVVYTYKTADGKPIAISYIGKSSKKVWHYRFKDEAQLQAKIDKFFEAVAQRQAFKAKIKEDGKNFEHSYKVGDILYSSWGYDQTNIEFYQITATTKKTVTFQEIAQTRTRTGHDDGTCSPVKDKFIEGEKTYTRTVRGSSYNEKGSVSFAEYEGGMKRHLSFVDRVQYHFSDGH